ncbi:hypothetical protein MMPV_009153 [Pyropia vietnamensis]
MPPRLVIPSLHHIKVPPTIPPGTRLDRFLRRALPPADPLPTQGALHVAARRGGLRLNGAPARPGDRVGPGDTVSVRLATPHAPPWLSATASVGLGGDGGRCRPGGVPPGDDGDGIGGGGGFDGSVGRRRRRRPPHPWTTSAAAAPWLAARVVAAGPWGWVLDKPAGLPVQGGTGVGVCLDDLLPWLPGASGTGGSPRDGGRSGAWWDDDDGGDAPRLVHRLDARVSGVLLVARGWAAAAAAGAAFRGDAGGGGERLHKAYVGILIWHEALAGASRRGSHDSGGRLTPPRLVTGARGTVRMDIDGRDAATRWAVLGSTLDGSGGRGGGGGRAVVALWPEGGRKHQLRRHTAWGLGAALLGDERYGRTAAATAAAMATATPAASDGAAPLGRVVHPWAGPRVRGVLPIHLHAAAMTLPRCWGGGGAVAVPVPAYMAAAAGEVGFDLAAWDPLDGIRGGGGGG